MTMKHSLIFCLVLFSAIFIACNKNENSLPPLAGTPMIKKDTHSGGSWTSYEYDVQGRVTQRLYSFGSKTIFIYNAAVIHEQGFDNAGVMNQESIHEIGVSGYVEKTTYPGSISRTTRQYNAAGQLTNVHFMTSPLSDSSDFFYYYSPSGQLDSVIFARNNNTINEYKEYYEYALDKSNTTSSLNTGTVFFGKPQSTKPITRSTVVYPDGTQTVDTYTYVYDTYNRIIKTTYNGADFSTFIYY